MNEKSNLFKTSLSFPVFEPYNTAIFHLLHTPKYKNYTDVVLSSLGLEIEKYLKPEDFTLKYRYKSKKSFFQNLSQDSKVVNNEISSNFNKFIPYDVIGMRLVIKNVPEDFQISNHFIENSKKKLELIKQELYKLKTIPSYPTNDETLDKEIVAKYRQLDSQMHYLTNCINFKNILSKRNLIKQDIETIDKNLASNPNDISLLNEKYTAHNLLGNLNNTLCMIVGEYIINDIFENSEPIKKLGLSLNPNRQKYFYDNTGYNSIHFCLESSSMPNWICELQDRSSLVEYLSKYGPSSTHDQIPGKKRRLIPLPKKSNSTDVHKYIDKIKYVLPLYTKYISHGFIQQYTKKQNVEHYYKKLFSENKSYANEAEELLYTRPTNIYLPKLDENLEKSK